MNDNRMNDTMRGRGGGMGRGGGGGMGRGGGGMGRGGGRRGSDSAALGADGACVCPKCSAQSAHSAGVPCMDERCPSCGCALVREGSPHHQQLLRRQQDRQEQNRADADE